MTGPQDRLSLISGVESASQSGARLSIACTLSGISTRTFQRWERTDWAVAAAPRQCAPRLRLRSLRPSAKRCCTLPTRTGLPIRHGRVSRPCWRTEDATSPESQASSTFCAPGRSRHRGQARAPRPQPHIDHALRDCARSGLVLGYELRLV